MSNIVAKTFQKNDHKWNAKGAPSVQTQGRRYEECDKRNNFNLVTGTGQELNLGW